MAKRKSSIPPKGTLVELRQAFKVEGWELIGKGMAATKRNVGTVLFMKTQEPRVYVWGYI